jgi:hypothetical protein
MTYADFKTTVLSYVNRSSSIFTSGSLDYVLAAMNDARRAAQRDYTFNLNRTPAFVQLSLNGQSLLTDFDTTPVSTTLIVMKQVDAVYEYDSASVSGTTKYYRTAKIPYFRQSVFELELKTSAAYLSGSTTQVVGTEAITKQFAYMQGVKMYHSTLTTPTWVMVDGVEWLADHAGGAVEDIFLTYFADWLKYATLMNLNQFLKDGERFSIDATFFNNLWESVKQFDAQQGASTGAISLD